MKKIIIVTISIITLLFALPNLVFASETRIDLQLDELMRNAQAAFDLQLIGEDDQNCELVDFREGVFYLAHFADGKANIYTYTDALEYLCEIPFPENSEPFDMVIDQDKNIVFYNVLRTPGDADYTAEFLIYDGDTHRINLQLPDDVWPATAHSFHVMGAYYVVNYIDTSIVFNHAGETVSIIDEPYFTITTDKTNICGVIEGMQNVELIHAETGDKIIVPYPPSGEIAFIDRLFVDDQNIYAYCHLGIVAYRFETQIWELLVPHESLLFMTGFHEIRRIFYGNGNLYINSRELGESGYVYYNHIIRPATESATLRKLRIVSACNAFYIPPAIYQYKLEHPDVQIEYRAFINEGGLQWPSSHFIQYQNMQDFFVRQNDALMTINTELLGSDNIDIIILDGLPIDRYIKNGLLYDLSEWADDRHINGEWISGIATAYMQDNGSLPCLPLSASADVIWGEKETLDSISTFADLGEYALQLPEKAILWGPLYNQDAPSMVVKFFPMCADSFRNENGELDFSSEKFIDYLNMCKALQNRLVERAIHMPATELLQLQDRFLQGDIALFSNLLNTNPEYPMEFLDFLAYRGQEATLISLPNMSDKNYFYPAQVVGITQKSENKDIALDFLNTLTSESVLQTRINEYIPLSQSALEYNLRPVDRGSFVDYSEYGTDNTPIPLVFIDAALKEKILGFAHTLNTPVSTEYDFQFLTMLYEETLPYINGEISAAQAVQALISRTNIYLSE